MFLIYYPENVLEEFSFISSLVISFISSTVCMKEAAFKIMGWPPAILQKWSLVIDFFKYQYELMDLSTPHILTHSSWYFYWKGLTFTNWASENPRGSWAFHFKSEDYSFKLFSVLGFLLVKINTELKHRLWNSSTNHADLLRR